MQLQIQIQFDSIQVHASIRILCTLFMCFVFDVSVIDFFLNVWSSLVV